LPDIQSILTPPNTSTYTLHYVIGEVSCHLSYIEEEFIMRIVLGLLFLAALSLPDMALAQTAAEREACRTDFEKFCPGVRPGGGRIIECLGEHLSELTPECQKVVKAHMPE
jgi:Cysteine rich repeat